MPTLIMQVERGPGRIRLAPADPYTAEQMDELRDDQLYTVTVAVNRGRGQGPKGKWWAGLALLATSADNAEYPTAKKWAEHIMVELGFSHQEPHKEGPRTVADNLADMEDEDVRTMLEMARGFVVGEMGFDPWEQWEQQKAQQKAWRVRPEQ